MDEKKNESKNRLLPCYGHNANEETAIFNKRPSWNIEDTIDEKYLEFLAPHSRRYFSRLRPLFSFEVKSLTSLNAFSHVLLQDGVLYLMRFFQRFPTPHGLMSKILIHENLGTLIPKAWKEHILYYRVQGSEATEVSNKKKNLFLYLSFAQFHSDEEAISQLRETLKSYQGKVFVVTNLNILRGEDYLNYDRSFAFNHAHKLFAEIDVEFIDFGNLGSALSTFKLESDFLVFNPYQYWFSDSYLEHYFYNQGISRSPEKSEKFDKGDICESIALGPHHAMVISEDFVASKSTHSFLYEQMQYPHGETFQREPVVDRNIEDYFKVKYSSQALEKLAFSVAKKLRKEA